MHQVWTTRHHLLRHHAAHAVTDQGHARSGGCVRQPFDQFDAFFGQPFEGVRFDRIAVPVARHVPGDGSKAGLRQRFKLRGKSQMPTANAMQHEHSGS